MLELPYLSLGSADPPTTTAAGRLSNPGEPSSSGKDFFLRDDNLAQETDVAPLGQLMITYDHTMTARLNSNVAEDDCQATEIRGHDNDKHLDLAQASAQDALTTATSALAQSHMVWARLHSQDHSDEGIARDARISSVAATVAAAASDAKAAVEAARAIAEVSVDAFIQSGGYQVGDTSLAQLGSTRSRPVQVASLDQSHSNLMENSSQHRTNMVESVGPLQLRAKLTKPPRTSDTSQASATGGSHISFTVSIDIDISILNRLLRLC